MNEVRCGRCDWTGSLDDLATHNQEEHGGDIPVTSADAPRRFGWVHISTNGGRYRMTTGGGLDRAAVIGILGDMAAGLALGLVKKGPVPAAAEVQADA